LLNAAFTGAEVAYLPNVVYRNNPRYVRDKGLYQVEASAKASGCGLWAH